MDTIEIAQPLLYGPRTLSETLAFLLANPGSQLIAGGTSRAAEAPVAVTLHLLDDLKRITSGDRSLDVGATAPLSALLSLPDTQIPVVLKEAIRTIGTSGLRNLATVGGNLCQKGTFGDLFPVLLLLGAQLELRGQRSSRWVSFQDLAEQGRLSLAAGELLTKIRLPLEQPGLHFYQKIGSYRTSWEEKLSMVCLASPKNGLLSRFRLVFSLPQLGLLRSRELEAELTGRRLPLPRQERDASLARLADFLAELPILPSVFQTERILHLSRWVLTRLDDD